jgi:8-oxo-dGTP pyrophosphatase MutT (NUDIX family)
VDGADYLAGLPAKRVAAGVLFTDRRERVLLVEPTYKPGWEFPGGAVMAAESPRSGAIREVMEELGLIVSGPLPLLVVDWMPPRDGRSESLVWLFDGGCLGPAEIAAIRLPPDELRSFRLVDLRQAEVLLPPQRNRRLTAAVAARFQTGRPVTWRTAGPRPDAGRPVAARVDPVGRCGGWEPGGRADALGRCGVRRGDRPG